MSVIKWVELPKAIFTASQIPKPAPQKPNVPDGRLLREPVLCAKSQCAREKSPRKFGNHRQ